MGRSSLIPVSGWTGFCPACGGHKGLRYPMVDLALVATYVLLGLRFGWTPMLVPYLLLAAVLVALSAIDMETHLLPNVIVWPSILIGLYVILFLSGELDYGAGIPSSLLGGAIFGGFIGLTHVLYEQGMGRGDVKLALLLGLYLGWPLPSLIETTRLVMYTILLALLGGGLVGLAYNLIRRRGRAEVPFGPALVAASIIMVAISPQLAETVSLP